jgi:hypothetical protein
MRRLFWSSFAFVPALGIALAVSPVAGAGTAGAHSAGARASADARAAAAARAALRYVSVGHPAGQRVPGSAHPIAGAPTQVSYYNWSGYADDNTGGHTYSKVSGSWKEPAITCTSEDRIAVFWVGIDGFTSSTVEQDGTLAQCFQGTAHYYTWWEMYPTNFIQLVGSTVAPSDSITGSVTRTGTKYTLKLTDSTHTANSFSTTQTCAATTCLNTSAEWIAESPSGNRGDYPLPPFGTWSLTGASVTSGATTGKISSFPDDEITMVDGTVSYNLVQPGALNATGSAFTATWKNSY